MSKVASWAQSGTALMVVAQLFFSLMVVCVKFARVELSGVEVVLWRSLASLPVLWWICRDGLWKISISRALLSRIGFGFAAMSAFYIAAKSLAVADLSMISKLMPILVALGAPALLGKQENPDSDLWWVTIVALLGCSILLMPSFQLGTSGGLWALVAAVFASAAHISLRALKNENAWSVVLWFQQGTVILATLTLIFTEGTVDAPPSNVWLPLAGVAALGTLGQFFMTWAYSKAKASTVSAASYLGPLWAIGADFVFFNLLPSWNFWLGGTILVFAGAWLIRKG